MSLLARRAALVALGGRLNSTAPAVTHSASPPQPTVAPRPWASAFMPLEEWLTTVPLFRTKQLFNHLGCVGAWPWQV